jgi:hypothetical protein
MRRPLQLIVREGAGPEGRALARRRPSWPLEKDNFCLRSVSDRAASPMVLDGPINGAWFEALVDRFLVPTPVRGHIVVIDNLGSHVGASDTGQSGPEAKNALCSCKRSVMRAGQAWKKLPREHKHGDDKTMGWIRLALISEERFVEHCIGVVIVGRATIL